MISIICAYNNKNILEKFLISSLKKQNYKDYELILINSEEKGFKSASQALNYGVQVAKGELIVLSHQDIELVGNDVLEKIVLYSKKYDFGIAGVAGVEYGNKIVYSSITHGDKKKDVGVKINEIKSVFSLDECFLVIKKEDFKGFHEYNSWHFYAVEYSIRCKLNNDNVLIFPLNIYHLSEGKSLNDNYWITLKKVAKEYKKLKYIPTTFAQFRNGILLKLQITKLKMKLKNKY